MPPESGRQADAAAPDALLAHAHERSVYYPRRMPVLQQSSSADFGAAGTPLIIEHHLHPRALLVDTQSVCAASTLGEPAVWPPAAWSAYVAVPSRGVPTRRAADGRPRPAPDAPPLWRNPCAHLPGAGTGQMLIRSLGAICSAFASAPISESLSRATSPRSIRSSCDLLIRPARRSPAATCPGRSGPGVPVGRSSALPQRPSGASPHRKRYWRMR